MKFLLSFSLLLFFLACSKEKASEEKKSDNLYAFDKAFEYSDRNQTDSAFIYFDKAKDQFLQTKDSSGVGKSLINMAIILTENADYFGGQETSIRALKYLDETNPKNDFYLSANFNNLGIASQNLKDYQNSLKFYDTAIKLSHDSLNTRIYLNNKAKLYQEIKNYKEALNIFNQLLKGTNKNQAEYSRVISNIAKTRWLQNPDYDPRPEFLKALNMRLKENDLWGQNSSYAHLTDYYVKKRSDSALFYANKMYSFAKKLKSPTDQLEALQKLIKLSPPKEAKEYFETYHDLDDSIKNARNAAKNQFALIRYEAEKNKADNLKLQQDNTEKEFQITKQRILLFITFLVLTAGSVIAILWYKKRKQKLELEAQNMIRENQLKTSKKVHDVVANGLYRVMTEIENQDSLDRESILDKLDNMYEKSREISYEEVQFTDQNFHEKISDLLRSFATETTKVVIGGNNAELWKKVNAQVKYEIEHVLQELMVNMKKHSSASSVAARFELDKNQINIYYADNGIGIKEETLFKNGLRNTGNRIDSICGKIIFDTKADKGLKIQISFPIS